MIPPGWSVEELLTFQGILIQTNETERTSADATRSAPLHGDPPEAHVLVVTLNGPDARGFVFSARAAADATGLILPDGEVNIEGRIQVRSRWTAPRLDRRRSAT